MPRILAALLASLLFVLSFPSLAGTFDLPMQIRDARALFEARRYRDAEVLFKSVYEAQVSANNTAPEKHVIDSHLEVLDYYARSISQQGKTDHVLPLLQSRHVIVSQVYHQHSFAFASSLGRLAEANYRAGNRHRALDYIQHAVKLYKALNPVPSEAVELAETNQLQYKVAPFSAAMLPMDLSEFYSRCATIESGATATNATELMQDFVEVGIDFVPTGTWVDYFNALQQVVIDETGEVQRKRVFIPAEHENLRSELCFVVEKSGTVINAESILD